MMRGIEQYLQVDAATLGALKYAGTWNASTNTPTLTSGVGTQGQYYVVSVAGSTNLDGETNWQVGDWAVFNGSVWQKVDGGSTGLLSTLTVTGNTYLATTSGNVGVGTSSPTNKLHVVGSGDILRFTNGTVSLYGYSDSAGLGWFTGTVGTNVGVYYNNTSSYQSFYTSSTERMRITSAGDVGIGTSSPASKLHVVGDIQQDNANYIKGKLAAGTATRLFGLNAANSLYIGGIDASQSETLFTRGGTTQMTIDTSGNLGLGVTPSAWTLFKPVEIGAVGTYVSGRPGSNQLDIGCNNYYNSGYKYASTGAATIYEQNAGQHIWFTAPSGTAGNAISFTQAMTLDASGRLLVGTTTAGIGNNNATALSVANGTATVYQSIRASGGEELYLYSAAGSVGLYSYTNHPLVFGTNNAERLRITSAGNIHTPAGATTMTNGFFYIPAAAGVPTGVPTAITGTVPMYYDTTNNKFYVYNGAWKSVALL